MHARLNLIEKWFSKLLIHTLVVGSALYTLFKKSIATSFDKKRVKYLITGRISILKNCCFLLETFQANKKLPRFMNNLSYNNLDSHI